MNTEQKFQRPWGVPDLLEVLRECEEYFDQRADADYSDHAGAAVGNAEMHLLMSVREAIARAGLP